MFYNNKLDTTQTIIMIIIMANCDSVHSFNSATPHDTTRSPNDRLVEVSKAFRFIIR